MCIHDVQMVMYNFMKDCEHVVNDEQWCFVYLYIIHVFQLNIMMYILTLFVVVVFMCLYSWSTYTQDEEL